MDFSSVFNLDTTYFNLPEKFYSKIQLQGAPNPEWFLTNESLKKELSISSEFDDQLLAILSGNKVDGKSEPFSQAYAGHQFGHFTMLGDGRATLLGEHIDQNGNRWDIQLKGSGATPYSRRGDGKATLRSMLKEFIFSEAMYSMNIPTSRSLAVVKTGEKVYREEIHEGAILTRVMKSHIRIGTFEYARYFGSVDDVEKLMNYTIDRIYPDLKNSTNKALDLLERVMKVQIDLIVNWMRVGFIHGVMNTDNISISGETFDYGPCAFMGVYNPATVFSSIDKDGRYSFENQPKILKWNIARFAETLLPLIDEIEENAIEIATNKINEFDGLFSTKWYEMMFSKLGLVEKQDGDFLLVEEFLELLFKHQLDYTNSFAKLTFPEIMTDEIFQFPQEMNDWLEKWNIRVKENSNYLSTMKESNPILIPRNQFVELAIGGAEKNQPKEFLRLLEIIYNSKRISVIDSKYLLNDKEYDFQYKTFCGT